MKHTVQHGDHTHEVDAPEGTTFEVRANGSVVAAVPKDKQGEMPATHDGIPWKKLADHTHEVSIEELAVDPETAEQVRTLVEGIFASLTERDAEREARKTRLLEFRRTYLTDDAETTVEALAAMLKDTGMPPMARIQSIARVMVDESAAEAAQDTVLRIGAQVVEHAVLHAGELCDGCKQRLGPQEPIQRAGDFTLQMTLNHTDWGDGFTIACPFCPSDITPRREYYLSDGRLLLDHIRDRHRASGKDAIYLDSSRS